MYHVEHDYAAFRRDLTALYGRQEYGKRWPCCTIPTLFPQQDDVPLEDVPGSAAMIRSAIWHSKKRLTRLSYPGASWDEDLAFAGFQHTRS
jgi:hypothetical protein